MRAAPLAMGLAAAPVLSAQNRLVLPQGSVILVRTASTLESNNARVGQTFETIVDDSVFIDNYTAIPSGSRIRGVVSYVQPATRQQSGVIEVSFDRLTLSDGTAFTIAGRLTSTDSAERRQIETSTNQRVVLVGGRGGIGAVIAGAGQSSSSSNNILSALGSLLSEGRDVRVPAGTPLAVQLEQRLVLRSRGAIRRGDQATIYTAEATIRAAQQALAARNYYRGAIDGQLSYATQRALFEFQLDQSMTATGNLDGRTAQALGLNIAGTGTGSGVGGGVMSATDAATLRRAAQSVVGRVRQELAISTVGRLDTRRNYSEADVDLWFALSAFTDNTSLYEQIVRNGGNQQGILLAGRSLIEAARRVDTALQGSRMSFGTQSAWASIRTQLTALDSTYPR
jgi:peptidoglycan hydrolase-like protein with peptidoglycan-binding domain